MRPDPNKPALAGPMFSIKNHPESGISELDNWLFDSGNYDIHSYMHRHWNLRFLRVRYLLAL